MRLGGKDLDAGAGQRLSAEVNNDSARGWNLAGRGGSAGGVSVTDYCKKTQNLD